jgi:hypothetical protein
MWVMHGASEVLPVRSRLWWGIESMGGGAPAGGAERCPSTTRSTTARRTWLIINVATGSRFA